MLAGPSAHIAFMVLASLPTTLPVIAAPCGRPLVSPQGSYDVERASWRFATGIPASSRIAVSQIITLAPPSGDWGDTYGQQPGIAHYQKRGWSGAFELVGGSGGSDMLSAAWDKLTSAAMVVADKFTIKAAVRPNTYTDVLEQARTSATEAFTSQGLKPDPIAVDNAVKSAMRGIAKPGSNIIGYGFSEMTAAGSNAASHATDAIASGEAVLEPLDTDAASAATSDAAQTGTDTPAATGDGAPGPSTPPTTPATVAKITKFPIGPIPKGELPGQYYAPFSNIPGAPPLPAGFLSS